MVCVWVLKLLGVMNCSGWLFIVVGFYRWGWLVVWLNW